MFWHPCVKIVITVGLSMLALSCGDHSKERGERPNVRQAEFSTIQGCLRGIRTDAGRNIDIKTVDKPSKVSGVLTNGVTFACERKMTGSKGTYYLGWYVVQ